MTGEVYEYRKLSDDAYELCSTFATDTRSNPGEQRNRYNEWLHPEGRHCFEIKRNAAEP